ncbi:hypothetical protein [Halobacteriovorax sp. DPLXC-1]|uniref:hypothetical protein n=1 Tax=Halobacteriovorax sp. DPLXC-1 TaxID=3110771 RepID=UPI002FF3B1B7
MKFTLEQTIEILGLNQIENAIFSSLFIQQLYNGINTYNVDSGAVVRAIRGIGSSTQKKISKERQFYGEELKGLHYIHWFEARFIVKNLSNHWKLDCENSMKFHSQTKQSFSKQGIRIGDYISEEAINQFTHDFVQGFHDRALSNKLTGERVIYLNHNDERYFLTLAFHSESDEEVRQRIEKFCFSEWPFIKDYLNTSNNQNHH